MKVATLTERLKAFEGQEAGSRTARDPVNEAMIHHWCDAVGDRNPAYPAVAPPTMLQVWTMLGLAPERPDRGAMDELMSTLDEAGFTSVVATNCEQTYERYLRPGDLVAERTVVEEVSDEKTTGLGVGHFVTLRTTYSVSDEVVGTMLFRILKYRPAQGLPRRPKPTISQDTAFFWDAAKRGKLVIQRCVDCRELRHPPRPMCPHCRSLDWDTVTSTGRGVVHSFVVHHYPETPGFEYPLPIVLVALEEGTRIVANLLDVDPADIEIGMPVEVTFERYADDLVLPQFRPR